MLSGPEVFMAVANATAAIVQTAPPYITYHVHAVFHFAGDGTADRIVTVRSDDGLAIVHDEQSGKDELRTPFPASPAFDALSRYTMTAQVSIGKGGAHDGDMRITNVEPLHYEALVSHADAVAHSIKGYVVTIADDATPTLGHLHLERNVTLRDARKWLQDVWYDPVTMLPTRIVWGGISDFTLDAHYAVVDHYWLLQSISAAEVVHAPLWLARGTASVSGAYEGYAFSRTAPDPRLAPTAGPVKAAAP